MKRPRIPGFIVVTVMMAWCAGQASAHTTNICWRAEPDGTITFFVATYHPGDHRAGGIKIGENTYDFTGQRKTLPADITACQPNACVGVPPVNRWQTVNVAGIQPGVEHTFTTSCIGYIDCPVDGCYPQVADFGGCFDSDTDGLCDEADNCPNAANADQADADGDGIGDVCDFCPNGGDTDTDGDGVIDSCCGSSGGLGDWDFCSEACPCDVGEGDCDTNSECEAGLSCVHDIGASYGWDPEVDVCETDCHTDPLGDWDYCSSSCPCEDGEGDCDNDSECLEGLECVNNVGADYGFESDRDVCVGTAVPESTSTQEECGPGETCAPASRSATLDSWIRALVDMLMDTIREPGKKTPRDPKDGAAKETKEKAPARPAGAQP